MRIEVLGPIRFSTDEGVPVEVAERKLRLLLAALVAADGAPVSADALIDRLWHERLPTHPRNVLRAKLSHLRGVLDKARPDGRRLLRHTPAGYRLTVEPDTVDAARFKGAVERARRLASPRQKTVELRRALGMWRGEPYGDIADELWLTPTITELQDVHGDAVELLVETLVEDGRPEEALEAANGAVNTSSVRERLVGASMLALYQVGRQHEALEMFESLRRRLAEELGVDPGPRVRELHGRILRQEPTLDTTTAPAGPVRRGVRERTNVPAETAPLIGREREVEEVAALLDRSRLVTMTGLGGVGKTRLALHLARGREARVEHGVWFVDLTELTRTAQEHSASGERIASLTVDVLNLPEPDPRTNDIDRLCEALGALSALLVLDNCEHVVVEAAVFVTELLRKAPGVRVLATSREPLGLPEEHRHEVSTLSTEPDDAHPVSDAVEFFAVRARSNDPAFRLDEGTLPVVTELCRRLDGLPLALELAAARIRGISARDLLERLSDRLNLLSRPGGRVPRRQQTLRAMIDGSWTLLDPTERAVLRRLAVHPGSVPLTTAEVICADAPEDVDAVVEPTQVVDALIGLVDRSMVRTVASPTGVRYGLLESIATFAAEKLDDAGERERIALRHLDHHLELAREADRRLRGPEQRRWLARLEAERTQLRNAFDEAVRTRDGGKAVALTVATFWHQWIFGRHSTLNQDLRTATNLPGPQDDTRAAATTLLVCVSLDEHPGEEARLVREALSLFTDGGVVRARVQWFAGTSLLAVGVRDAGEHHVDEATGVLLAAGEDWDLAVAACQRDWFVVRNWGDPPRGLPDGRDPERVLRDLGDGYGLMHVFDVEHRIAEVEGDHLRAAAAAQRALEVCLESGLWAEASYWYAATALAALSSGDVGRAVERVEKARSLAHDTAGGEHGSNFADLVELMIARYRGDLGRARDLSERWRSGGGLGATADSGAHLEEGFLAIQLGDLDRAEKAYRSVHSLTTHRTRPLMIARALELAAAIHALRASPVAAAELLGTAAALRAQDKGRPPVPVLQDIDRVHAMVHEQASRQQATEAFRRGRDLALDDRSAAMALPP